MWTLLKTILKIVSIHITLFIAPQSLLKKNKKCMKYRYVYKTNGFHYTYFHTNKNFWISIVFDKKTFSARAQVLYIPSSPDKKQKIYSHMFLA
jgi:hypothetical protein